MVYSREEWNTGTIWREVRCVVPHKNPGGTTSPTFYIVFQYKVPFHLVSAWRPFLHIVEVYWYRQYIVCVLWKSHEQNEINWFALKCTWSMDVTIRPWSNCVVGLHACVCFSLKFMDSRCQCVIVGHVYGGA